MEKNSLQLNKNSQLRRQRRMRVLFVAALLVLVSIVLVVGILRRQEFQIIDIAITGAQATDPSLIQSFADKQITGNYFFVIPKTNALLFSKTAMRRAVLNEFPNLRDAVPEFPQRNHLVIRVTEKDPAYVWCDSSLLAGERLGVRSCWFADRDGVIYGQAPHFSDGVFIIFSGTADGNDLPHDPRRARFASGNEFDRIKTFIESLQGKTQIAEISYLKPEINVNTDQSPNVSNSNAPVMLGDVAIRITDLYGHVVSRNSIIKTTQLSRPDAILQSLDLLMSQGKFADLLKSQPELLEYIDLRFDGKIYYKFKLQAAAPVEDDKITQ